LSKQIKIPNPSQALENDSFHFPSQQMHDLLIEKTELKGKALLNFQVPKTPQKPKPAFLS
jgi:hypothetical protein